MSLGQASPLLSGHLVRLSVMDRYITTELVIPFLFGVGAFSSIGLAVGTLFELVQEVSEAAVPLFVALQVILLQMPYFISLSLPMATLLATLMAYSRLGKDSEITALQGCGVSAYRLVLPALIFSLLVTGVTFGFSEVLVPSARYQASALLDQVLQQDKLAVNEKNIFYPEYGANQELVRLFYAHQIDGRRLRGLTILDFSRAQQFNQVITAESATWSPAQNTWNFFNGTIYLVAPDGSYRNTLRFEHQQLQIPQQPINLAKSRRHSTEMNLVEAGQYLEELRQNGDEKTTRKLAVKIQQRYAAPWMCVGYGLIGATLGVRPRRKGTAAGFGISVLIIFAHYLLSFLTGALGQVGLISPLEAAWLPTVLGLGAGVWLLLSAR